MPKDFNTARTCLSSWGSRAANTTGTRSAAPAGLITMLVSAADRAVYDYRNGEPIGRAAIEVKGRLGGHVFTMLEGVSAADSSLVPGRAAHLWMSVRSTAAKPQRGRGCARQTRPHLAGVCRKGLRHAQARRDAHRYRSTSGAQSEPRFHHSRRLDLWEVSRLTVVQKLQEQTKENRACRFESLRSPFPPCRRSPFAVAVLQPTRLGEMKGEAGPVRETPFATGNGNPPLRLESVELVSAGRLNRNASTVYRDCFQVYPQRTRGRPGPERGLDHPDDLRSLRQQDLSFDNNGLFELGFERRTDVFVTRDRLNCPCNQDCARRDRSRCTEGNRCDKNGDRDRDGFLHGRDWFPVHRSVTRPAISEYETKVP